MRLKRRRRQTAEQLAERIAYATRHRLNELGKRRLKAQLRRGMNVAEGSRLLAQRSTSRKSASA